MITSFRSRLPRTAACVFAALSIATPVLVVVPIGCGDAHDDDHTGHAHDADRAAAADNSANTRGSEGGDPAAVDAGHADSSAGHAHDSARSLGSVTIGEVVFNVSISGETKPGAEVHIDIEQTAGPTPVAVRLWIGEASGVGSLRSRADGHDNHFHGHAEVPAPLGPAAALWIEVESAAGTQTSASVPLEG